MNVYLSNEELKTLITALVRMPWIEVNDLITKLTGPRLDPVPTTVTVTTPHGLKKDGTPAKKRGRPAKRRKVQQ